MCRFLLQGIIFVLAFCRTDQALCAAVSSSSSAGSSSARSFSADVLEQEYKRENVSVRSSGGLWVAVKNKATNQLEPYFLSEKVVRFLTQYNTRLGIAWKNCNEVQTDGLKKPNNCDDLPLAGGAGCSRKTAELFCRFIEDEKMSHEVKSFPDLHDLQETEDLFAFVFEEFSSVDECHVVNAVLTKILQQYTYVVRAMFRSYIREEDPTLAEQPEAFELRALCFMLDLARRSPLDLTNVQMMGHSQKFWSGIQHVLGKRPESRFLNSNLSLGILQEVNRIPLPEIKLKAHPRFLFTPQSTWLLIKLEQGYFLQHCYEKQKKIRLPLVDDNLAGQQSYCYNSHYPYGGVDLSGNDRWLCWVNQGQSGIFYVLDLSQSTNPAEAYKFTFGQNLVIKNFAFCGDQKIFFSLANVSSGSGMVSYDMEDLIMEHKGPVCDLSSLTNAKACHIPEDITAVPWLKQQEDTGELPIRDVFRAGSICNTRGKIAIWTTGNEIIIYDMAKDLDGLTLRQLLLLQALLSVGGGRYANSIQQQAADEVELFLQNLPTRKPIFSQEASFSLSERAQLHFGYSMAPTHEYKAKLVQEHEQRPAKLCTVERNSWRIPVWAKKFLCKSSVRIVACCLLAVALGCGGYYLRRRGHSSMKPKNLLLAKL